MKWESIICPRRVRFATFRSQEGRGRGGNGAEGEHKSWEQDDVSKALKSHRQDRHYVPSGAIRLSGVLVYRTVPRFLWRSVLIALFALPGFLFIRWRVIDGERVPRFPAAALPPGPAHAKRGGGALAEGEPADWGVSGQPPRAAEENGRQGKVKVSPFLTTAPTLF